MPDKNESSLLTDLVFPGNKQPWNLMMWNDLLWSTVLRVGWAVPWLGSLGFSGASGASRWRVSWVGRESPAHWRAVSAGCELGTLPLIFQWAMCLQGRVSRGENRELQGLLRCSFRNHIPSFLPRSPDRIHRSGQADLKGVAKIHRKGVYTPGWVVSVP